MGITSNSYKCRDHKFGASENALKDFVILQGLFWSLQVWVVCFLGKISKPIIIVVTKV